MEYAVGPTSLVDNLSQDKRSKVMASIRGKNTTPELTIRRLLWAAGKRYRIHDRAVFGRPDISNKGKKVAVFIDGCFWHGCEKCYKAPTTNADFWKEKVMGNKLRRKVVMQKLSSQDWKVLEFWEHQIIREAGSIAREISVLL